MGFLENLIILAIMTIALFSGINAQNLAFKKCHALYYQNRALEQAQTLMERFRTVQSAEEMAQEYHLFETQLSQFLPSGHSESACIYHQHECTISIFWQDHGGQSLNLSSLI